MNHAHTPIHEGPEPGTLPAVSSPEIEMRVLTEAQDMVLVSQMFQQVWGSATEVVPLEILMAISLSGGYVVGAFDTSRRDPGRKDSGRRDSSGNESGRPGHGEILGASVALLATHQGRPALHSHVTGILAGARSHGLGRALKQHQQAWAVERGIEWIVWTFDPLVRRNAWFNIAILGAEVHDYLPDFYGEMTDAINAGDRSDRLLVAWPTDHDAEAGLRDGSGITDTTLIPTPPDIIALRRTDPTAVARWRTDTRAALTAALADGRQVVGFTRDGDYVVTR